MPDPLASTLAGVQQRADAAAAMDIDVLAAFNGVSIGGVIAASAVDVPPLLAAVEAVLEEAADWTKTAAILDGKAERALDTGKLSGPATSALLSGRAQAYQDCAQALREAITAALLGEGAGDEK